MGVLDLGLGQLNSSWRRAKGEGIARVSEEEKGIRGKFEMKTRAFWE